MNPQYKGKPVFKKSPEAGFTLWLNKPGTRYYSGRLLKEDPDMSGAEKDEYKPFPLDLLIGRTFKVNNRGAWAHNLKLKVTALGIPYGELWAIVEGETEARKVAFENLAPTEWRLKPAYGFNPAIPGEEMHSSSVPAFQMSQSVGQREMKSVWHKGEYWIGGYSRWGLMKFAVLGRLGVEASHGDVYFFFRVRNLKGVERHIAGFFTSPTILFVDAVSARMHRRYFPNHRWININNTKTGGRW